VYTFFARLFIRPLLRETDLRKVALVQIAAKTMFWLGIVLLVLWAATKGLPMPREDDVPEGENPFNYKTLLGFSDATSILRFWDWDLVRGFIIETFGKSLFMTVLMADLFMRINLSVWNQARRFAGTDQAGDYDVLMGEVHNNIHSDGTVRRG